MPESRHPADRPDRQRACYWCLYRGRTLPVDVDGMVMHDAVPHPMSATFDEEDRPQ